METKQQEGLTLISKKREGIIERDGQRFIDATPTWDGVLRMARGMGRGMEGWGITFFQASISECQDDIGLDSYRAAVAVLAEGTPRGATSDGDNVHIPDFEVADEEKEIIDHLFTLEQQRIKVSELDDCVLWVDEDPDNEDEEAEEYNGVLNRAKDLIRRRIFEEARRFQRVMNCMSCGAKLATPGGLIGTADDKNYCSQCR